MHSGGALWLPCIGRGLPSILGGGGGSGGGGSCGSLLDHICIVTCDTKLQLGKVLQEYIPVLFKRNYLLENKK